MSSVELSGDNAGSDWFEEGIECLRGQCGWALAHRLDLAGVDVVLKDVFGAAGSEDR